MMTIRRIEKAKIACHCRGVEQPECLNGFPFLDLKSFGNTKGAQVFPNDTSGFLLFFSKIDHAGAPAERLDAYRSRARKEINPDRILDLRSNHVEQSLA